MYLINNLYISIINISILLLFRVSYNISKLDVYYKGTYFFFKCIIN